MRVAYVGKSVAALGVSLPGQPSICCGFQYGIRFRKPSPPDEVFMADASGAVAEASDYELLDSDREEGADALVLEPRGFDLDDDDGEIIVVVVNERCLQNPRLLEWLTRTSTFDPDGPSSVLVFVPERDGTPRATRALRNRLRNTHVRADVLSYRPTLVG